VFDLLFQYKNIALGVSGGGDSMALAHMMAQWAVEHDRHIHLLTVNHNLRDDSQAEADQVAQYVKDFPNSSHHILTWNHDTKPETAVMEKARNARYTLMAEYCKSNNINVLSIAHHADDQLETFMFRLTKGSGLDGLCGMAEWTDYNDSLKIHRPLLDKTHADLIAYCQSQNLQWIEDPSNENENYARPRLRKTLVEEGFESKRFAKTLRRLSRAQQALDIITYEVIKDNCLPRESGDPGLQNNGSPIKSGMTLKWDNICKKPHDIQIRVLHKALVMVGETQGGYPPKLERVEDIVETIRPSKSATLFGCLITLSKDGKTLEIRRV
jgi:tRNA(Ile)-lysidine synthase